ncbi:uncharacterized protein LOC143237756 [Tachypleus tridentatus]|uniref:uncharacterized protein LOC143237756 n=1 Tax=Tachypleus tridentatus TaxID=6853 RepID=UPI003FD171C1
MPVWKKKIFHETFALILMTATCLSESNNKNGNYLKTIEKRFAEYHVRTDDVAESYHSIQDRRNGKSLEFLSRLFGFNKETNKLRLKYFNCESDQGARGICTTSSKCLEQGGQVSGSCREGRIKNYRNNKCCIFSSTCGDVITFNGTIFKSPNFPQRFQGSSSCQTVVPVDQNVCQLRLDFFHFTLLPPRNRRPNSVKCLDDVFTVTVDRGGNKIPPLCGENSGQHIYVDVTLSQQVALNIQISPDSFSRKWAIQVLQIPCGSPISAPDGCLQYYTGVTNVIKSFNYNPQPTGVHFLNDLSYAMCIRRENGFCSVSYREEGRRGFDIGPGNDPITGTRCCRLAYLLIPTGSTGRARMGNVGDRFCGGGLSPTGVVTSTIYPFTISFVSTDLLEESGVGPENDRVYSRFVSGRQMTGFSGKIRHEEENAASKNESKEATTEKVLARNLESRQRNFRFERDIEGTISDSILLEEQTLIELVNSPAMDNLLNYQIDKYFIDFQYNQLHFENKDENGEMLLSLDDVLNGRSNNTNNETTLEGRKDDVSLWVDCNENECEINCDKNCKMYCNRNFKDSDKRRNCKEECFSNSRVKCENRYKKATKATATLTIQNL